MIRHINEEKADSRHIDVGWTVPADIFLCQYTYSECEVMQFGEHTERGSQRPAETHSFPRPYIKIHIFQGGGFGTFCDGFSRAIPVSCVLDRGGMSA